MGRAEWHEIQKDKDKHSRIIIIGVIIAVGVGAGFAAYFMSTAGTGQQQGIISSTNKRIATKTWHIDTVGDDDKRTINGIEIVPAAKIV